MAVMADGVFSGRVLQRIAVMTDGALQRMAVITDGGYNGWLL
jgi:hypothetical protein